MIDDHFGGSEGEKKPVPYYIAKKPWYYEHDALEVDSNVRKGRDEPKPTSYKHQRKDLDHEEEPYNVPKGGEGISDEFVEVHTTRRKRRKGGCDNCGSTQHKTRDCLEKPRKVKFKYRKDKSVHVDKVLVRKESENWDAKRDRWHGYDDKEYDDQLKKMKEQEQEVAPAEAFDEDELEEMRELGLLSDKSATIKSTEPQDTTAKMSTRSLDEKATYLEGIKIGQAPEEAEKLAAIEELKRTDNGFVSAGTAKNQVDIAESAHRPHKPEFVPDETTEELAQAPAEQPTLQTHNAYESDAKQVHIAERRTLLKRYEGNS